MNNGYKWSIVKFYGEKPKLQGMREITKRVKVRYVTGRTRWEDERVEEKIYKEIKMWEVISHNEIAVTTTDKNIYNFPDNRSYRNHTKIIYNREKETATIYHIRETYHCIWEGEEERDYKIFGWAEEKYCPKDHVMERDFYTGKYEHKKPYVYNPKSGSSESGGGLFYEDCD